MASTWLGWKSSGLTGMDDFRRWKRYGRVHWDKWVIIFCSFYYFLFGVDFVRYHVSCTVATQLHPSTKCKCLVLFWTSITTLFSSLQVLKFWSSFNFLLRPSVHDDYPLFISLSLHIPCQVKTLSSRFPLFESTYTISFAPNSFGCTLTFFTYTIV